MFNPSQIMQTLSSVRPVFYSEADFQHAFAWEIQLQFPNYRVRLEYPSSLDSEPAEHLDVLASNDNHEVAIEFKYKTTLFLAPIKGEVFLLKGQGAQDSGRYDFLKDVQRLERYLSERSNAIGYAIFLTNDSSYWNPSRNESTASDNFRLTEGGRITGRLNWGTKAGKGTIKGRELPIVLKGTCVCEWQDYSHIEQHECVRGSRQFRYLMLEVANTRD